MRHSRFPSVKIGPGTVNRATLEEAIQAMDHVDSILAINNDFTIEPGHLGGMSLMLKNAQKALKARRDALPAMCHERRPTTDSTAWAGIGPRYTVMNRTAYPWRSLMSL